MCGIAGVYLQQAPQAVERMIHQLVHRGPDGQGVKNLPKGTLGHTRLAILDVEGGQQPMGIGGTWITFNGEIYNYRELASEHLKDEPLRTHSDTEVILHLYRKFGPRCVELLDGMFALAIIDGNELFLARDPLGIKPLYCGQQDGAFYFASEVKALAQVTNTIQEFPAGCWFHSHTGWHPYFEIDSMEENGHSEADAIKLIRVVLKEAVRKRLLADVPVGISLSGGLDSSIVAMLADQEAASLHTFAVGMQDSEDLVAARKMAAILGTQHHERIYTEDEMLAALPKVIYHLESFDPALVRSAIPNFFLAELASKYVKVILTGEGADEIYAGYDYLRAIESPDELQDEMMDITAALHNTNLQRADRISMAFGLESRVPFLDVKSIILGLSLPPEQKTHRDRPAKYLLRRAFRDDLPEEIVNRPKQKFSKGAGSSQIIVQIAEREIGNATFQSESARLLNRWGYRLSNKEALYYYQILRQHFEDQWIFPSMGQSQSL
ncbi:MAG TPA: asparagine synthase B [Anaerolineales bacterium]|nr:asparagine synthase B [Anaerolineales bacterium]